MESLEDRSLMATQVFANVPEAANYTLAYELNITNTNNFTAGVPYSVNNAAQITGNFDRIGYYLELQQGAGPLNWVFVSADAFTTNINQVGVPNATSGGIFQQTLTNMNVASNVAGIVTGTGLSTGNIEFWRNDYSQANAIGIPNANAGAFDFGDTRSGGGTHGSMQIHNHDVDGAGPGTTGQTLFAFNNWNNATAGQAALGIGTQPTGSPDWTFAANVGSYTVKNLAVLVRQTYTPATAPAAPPALVANAPELANYQLVYHKDLTTSSANGTPITYQTNNTAQVPNGSFDRVAYYLQLNATFAEASFNAAGFTNNATRIGIPNTNSGEFYQQQVTSMNVTSNVGGVVNGTNIATGNIEFWPSNYGTGTTLAGIGGNGSNFDFNDNGAGTGAGYGSMQVHDWGASQTVFAYNNFGGGGGEMGIGNQPSGHPDWTFSGNVPASRNLYVLVQPKEVGTSGNDTITLKRVNGLIQYQITGAAGPVVVSSTAPLVINGLDGNDTLIVDYSGGNPIPTGGLTFNGGNPTTGPGDKLIVQGGTHTLVTKNHTDSNSGSVVLDGSTIVYTGLEPVDITGTTITSLVINLPDTDDATDDNTTFGISAGNLIVDSTNGEHEDDVIALAGITSLTINGRAGDDVITLLSTMSAFTGSITIDGGANTDDINLNAALTLGGNSLTVTGETIDVGAVAISTTSGNQTYNGALSLAGSTLSTGAGSVTLGGNVSVGGAALSTISGNLNLGGATQTFTVADAVAGAGTDLSISAVVSNGGLDKAGPGTMLLSGNNTLAGGVTVNAGTLNLQTGSAGGVNINPLGTSSLAVNNTANVIVSQGAVPAFGPANNLAMSWFTTGAATAMITNVGNNTATGGLLGAAPAGSRLHAGALNFGNDAAFQGSTTIPLTGAPLTAGDNYMFLYRGYFTPAVTGTYQFGVGNQAAGSNIDDEAAIYIDTTGNGLFDTTAGERVAYRATAGGSDAGAAVSLTAGVAYPIAIAYREATGGAVLIANVQRTSAPAVAWTNINSATGSGVGTFTAYSPANTFAANPVSVAGTAAIEIQVPGVNFGALSTAAGATLNLNGTGAGANNVVTFASAALADAATINTNTAAGYITGVVSQTTAGTLTKGGANLLTLTGANTYAGTTAITGGTLRLGNQNALGTIAGGTTISGGGTLDIHGFRVGPDGNEPISVEGTGVGGNGAIVNSRTASPLAVIRNIALTGNATFSSQFRWDIRDDGADPVTFDMNGFTLTKVGGAELCIVNGVVVDPGSVNVNTGIFRLEGSTDFDGTGTITVAGGATLDFWQNTQSFTVNLNLANTANLTTNDGAGTGPTLTGTITLNGIANFNLEKNSTFSGQLTGTGGFQKVTGTGILTLNNNSNNYAGSTIISAGTLVATVPNALGTTAGGTQVNNGATLLLDATSGPLNFSNEQLQLSGFGVGNAGALQSTGNNVLYNGTLNLQGSTMISNNTAGTTLTLNGNISREQSGAFQLSGAGDIDINGNITNGDFDLSPITARVFNGVQQAINDPTIITNDLNGTTVPTRTATLNGPLTFANAAAFNALFNTPSTIPLVDNFTTVFETTLTVITPGIYTFSVTNNDDGAAAWIKPSANAAFVAGDLLQGIVGNNNTAVATRNLAAGTYTLVYAQREGAGGEAVTGRIQGPGFVGVTTGTSLPIVNPAAIDDSLNHLVKTGTGTATLSGNNTYSGVTLVQQGVLTVDANNALGSAAPASGIVPVGVLSQQWQVGTDNGNNSEFSQENGSSNAAPGSATARDDDWYFAGTYPAPIGVVAANEALGGAPATGFERALTIGDPTDRIHFNLTADQLDDNYNLIIDTVSSSLSGGVDFQVLVNGNVVFTQNRTGDGTITTATFNGTDVGLTTGDNVVTLTRIGGTGPFLQFDYIRLNRQTAITAANTQVEAGTTLNVTGGITSPESLVMNGGLLTSPAGTNAVTGTVNLVVDTTIDVSGGASLELTNTVSGASDLTKTGAGTLILSGTNTYGGVTNVNAGTLQVENGDAIADTAGAVNVANLATFQLLSNETISSYVGADDGANENDSVLALGGNTLTTTGSATIANVTSANGGIVAGTNLIDGDTDSNVSGTGVFLGATTGSVGTLANPIETTVANLEGSAGTGFFVDSSTALNIGGVSAANGIAATGDIVVNSTVTLVVSENVSATGAGSDITLTTVDALGGGQDLTVNASATISSPNGVITLNAGDAAVINGTLVSGNTITVNIDTAADGGLGGSLSFAGDVDAPLAVFNGFGDSVGDSFSTIRPDQDVGDVLTPIQVNGFGPATTLNGDSLVLDITGLGIPTLTLGPGARNGSFSFGALAAPLTYTDIENVSTNPMLPYHLVLDMRFSGYENTVADTILAQLNAAGTELILDVNGANVFTGPDNVIQSLTIIGSADDDALTIQETAGGLPYFLGAAPLVNNTGIGGGVSNGSHLNGSADIMLEALVPGGTPWDTADVTMHFDGGAAGTDLLTLNRTVNALLGYFSDAADAGNSGNLASPFTPFLLSFANLEPLVLNGAGGGLITDATSTPATANLTITDVGAATQIVGDGGFAPTTLAGYTDLLVIGGDGSELIDLVSVDPATLTLVRLTGGNTSDSFAQPGVDLAADTLRIRSLPASVQALMFGAAGSDLFQLFDAGNTVDNIAGLVTVDGADGNVGGNTDTLTIVNTGGATADNLVIAPLNAAASQDYTIDGLTTVVGSDVVFRNIDDLNYTGTGLADTIDGRFVNTVPAHDLTVVNLSGSAGTDQFLLFTSDQIGGTGTNNTPTGVASGVANINLFGNADEDIFGATPPAPFTGTGAMNVGLVVSDDLRMIRPSASTAIAIDGGTPTGLAAPLGDVVGDVLNVNITQLPNATPVIVSTFSPGTVVATGIQPLTWVEIEDINLVDQGKLTNVQMGDLFARTTPNPDLVQITRNPTPLNPNQVRLRITASIGNYSASNKTIVYGGAMNDMLTQANLTIPAEFYGEAGDDYISGATNNDWLVGGEGNDRINGGQGDNIIWGDNSPTLPNDPQPQDLVAGGDDQLSGLSGNDVFYGGGGNDLVSAGGGNDYAYGGEGNDTLGGHDGDDRLYGGNGNDTISGHAGNDLLSGAGNDDLLYGDTGNDVLFGGTGADLIDGGSGNDLLVSGSVANETSSWTSQPTTATFSAATYTLGTDNDAALLALLTSWAATSNRGTLGTSPAITHDGANDDLWGSTGDDDFCWEAADVLDIFPATNPSDYNAAGMGTDERFGPT